VLLGVAVLDLVRRAHLGQVFLGGLAHLRDDRVVVVHLLQVHLQLGELLLHGIERHADVLALPLLARELLRLLGHLERCDVVRSLELLLQRELDPVHDRILGLQHPLLVVLLLITEPHVRVVLVRRHDASALERPTSGGVGRRRDLCTQRSLPLELPQQTWGGNCSGRALQGISCGTRCTPREGGRRKE